VPVIIISSEHGRAEACLKAGAAAYLPKPIQAPELRAVVARTLEEAHQKSRRGSLAVLMMKAGNIELGIPLNDVYQVLAQLPTRPLPFGPSYLRETFDLGDEPVCVLDMAAALSVSHAVPLQDRRLVLMRQGRLLLALCVDTVCDPEEFVAADVVLPEQLGGTGHGELARVLSAVVRSGRGSLAVVNPATLLSPDLLRELGLALSSVAGASDLAAPTP